MESEFAEIRAGITNAYLAVLLDEIFTDEMYRAYCQAPAAKGFHHNYIHGLLEHSVSVCRVADAIADQYPDVNRDLLMTGAILHDIGKTIEFDYITAIDYSDPGRLLGHIVLGEKIVADAIARLEAFPEETGAAAAAPDPLAPRREGVRLADQAEDSRGVHPQSRRRHRRQGQRLRAEAR